MFETRPVRVEAMGPAENSAVIPRSLRMGLQMDFQLTNNETATTVLISICVQADVFTYAQTFM